MNGYNRAISKNGLILGKPFIVSHYAQILLFTDFYQKLAKNLSYDDFFQQKPNRIHYPIFGAPNFIKLSWKLGSACWTQKRANKFTRYSQRSAYLEAFWVVSLYPHNDPLLEDGQGIANAKVSLPSFSRFSNLSCQISMGDSVDGVNPFTLTFKAVKLCFSVRTQKKIFPTSSLHLLYQVNI